MIPVLLLAPVLYIPLPTHPATINDQRVPADIRRAPTREVHDAALEVVGQAPPAGGDALADALEPLRVVEQRRVHVSRDVPGGDGVDRDAPAAPAVGERLCQLAHSAFARSVRGDVESALEREQAGKVYDAALAARDGARLEREHVRADVAAQGEDGAQVDLHDGGEVGVREDLARVPDLDARTVDEDPDLVAVSEDFWDQARHVGRRRQVCGVDVRLAVEGLD